MSKDSIFDGLALVDYSGDAFRNIVSLRKSINLFGDLVDTQEEADAAIRLVTQYKPFTQVSHQPIIDRPFEDGAYHDAIQYPFDHWNTSRYSNGKFGVWYGADTLETSIYETVHHWKKGYLADAGWDRDHTITVERRVHLVACNAALLDFKSRVAEFPSLIDPIDYSYTQQLGSRIKHDGYPGLITRSARCAGEVLATFTPKVLSNPRQYCYLTYRLVGGVVNVERTLGETLLTI